MGFASGLISQLGWAVETTAGTAVTVNKFQPHKSESIQFQVNRKQGEGIYGGTSAFPLASRHQLTTKGVTGDIEVELTDKGMGTLWRAALGSTTTPGVVSGSAYEAVFAPGDGKSAGSSLTVQAGRPQTDGTVKPFSWTGCKITNFEFGGGIDDTLTAKFGIDGWTEATSTSLATASYVTGAVQFTGAQLSINVGGTASTTSGKTTISGGTALTGVKSVTVKGENPLATDRIYAGASGVKAEQLINGWRKYEITLDMDFISQATLYDLFTANTTTALQLTWATTTAITGSNYPTLEVTASACKITNADVNVAGVDLTNQKVTFEVLNDGTNNPFQIRTISTDTTL